MKFKTNIFLLALLLTLVPHTSHAAVVAVVAPKDTYSVGDEFLVDTYINTEGESINAVEGTVVFPSTLMALKEIRTGNSIVTFWVDAPTMNGGNTIHFSGITPGGYSSPKGVVLSFVFQAKAIGKGYVEVSDIQVVKNDGVGTLAKITMKPYDFSILSATGSSPMLEQSVIDHDLPEPFTAIILKSPEVYSGNAFLVFATEDKGSGLDRYEVKEGFWASYKQAASPYLLEDQKLDKKIYIKAIDKNGNVRISVAYPAGYRPWYKDPSSIITIIVLAAAGLFISTKKKLFR